ncbi:MAG: HAMP domain-containing histidine kinase [Oscillospiraceae bacterium]|nr:HAMP domain-containing histidine kinase [Oscillospiraceae bacterium]
MNRRLRNQLIVSGIGALLLLLGAVWCITRGYGFYAVVLVTLVCFYIIGMMLWFWSRVSDPVTSLTDAARRIANGSYGVQVEKLGDDEVGDLADALNEMSEKVAVAEKTRTEFISRVSHELRTPLTAIEGWAETIAYDEAVQGDSLRGIQIISKEAERLTGMVSEMLEFARIQDGRFNLRIEMIDIAAELEDAIFTYGELLRQSGIEVKYDQPVSPIPMIPGDPERLKQVFLNLLDNAAKHGGEGRKIEVAIAAEGSVVIITIRDHGHGIPENELPHVKEKFYKGSSKGRGTGIGLSVCDEIVARHGGRLMIENAPGGGCLVTVTLPMRGGEGHEKKN